MRANRARASVMSSSTTLRVLIKPLKPQTGVRPCLRYQPMCHSRSGKRNKHFSLRKQTHTPTAKTAIFPHHPLKIPWIGPLLPGASTRRPRKRNSYNTTIRLCMEEGQETSTMVRFKLAASSKDLSKISNLSKSRLKRGSSLPGLLLGRPTLH